MSARGKRAGFGAPQLAREDRAALHAMASAARKRATYEDVLSAPEHMIAQVIDGELLLHPRPARRHTRVASRIGSSLDGPFDRGVGGPGGWFILFEPELHIGANGRQILVPDVAGWRRSRVPEFDDGAFFDLVPDWVCEVLSPSTASIDRGRKADIYAATGVGHMWLFDTDDCQMEAFENVDGRWLRLGAYAGCEERIAPFDPVPIDVPMLREGFNRAP